MRMQEGSLQTLIPPPHALKSLPVSLFFPHPLVRSISEGITVPPSCLFNHRRVKKPRTEIKIQQLC